MHHRISSFLALCLSVQRFNMHLEEFRFVKTLVTFGIINATDLLLQNMTEIVCFCWLILDILNWLDYKAPCKRSQPCCLQDVTLLGPTCCERLHTMLCVVATCWKLLDEVWSVSNFIQQLPTSRNATTHNMVCKRSQHVGPNNVASC